MGTDLQSRNTWRGVKMSGLVSILIPARDAEKTVEKAVRSALSQSYENIEVVVINDGSNDATPEILGRLASEDKRLRIIHTEGRGLSEARNTAVREARGDYLFFLDADDWISQDTIEDLQFLIEFLKADLAMTGTVRETMDGRFIDKTDNKYVGKFLRRDLETGYTRENGAEYVRIWGKLFRKEVLSSVHFPKGLRHEDVFVFPDVCANINSAVVSNRHGYHYIQRDDSIMHKPEDEHTIDVVLAACHVFDRWYADGKYDLLPGAEGKIYAAMQRQPRPRECPALKNNFARGKKMHLARVKKLKKLHLYSFHACLRNSVFYRRPVL